MHVELRVDVRRVSLDGVFGQHEAFGYRASAPSACEMRENLLFSRGQKEVHPDDFAGFIDADAVGVVRRLDEAPAFVGRRA